MKKVVNRTSQLIADLALLAGAFVMAHGLRFDWEVPGRVWGMVFVALPYVVALQYAALTAFGVPRFPWRHIGLREVVRIVGALTLASAVIVTVRLVGGVYAGQVPAAGKVIFPLGALAIHFLLSVFGVVGLRAARRASVERIEARRRGRSRNTRAALRTVLVGAGDAGLAVAKQLRARPDLGIRPVAFVDDDREKRGLLVHGVPVVGTTEDVSRVCRELRADQLLITIADAPGSLVRRIRRVAQDDDLPVKLVPGLHEIVGGRVSLSRFREVAIDDLLRRDRIRLDGDAINETLRSRRVMVTGAGGSIGSELCRQIAMREPHEVILVERSELALFTIHRELLRAYPGVSILPCIADITDRQRMEALFEEHRPHAVFHAAAHKHVPLMEANPGEAVKNNVFGTRTVADLARKWGVGRFVLISTDKAVRPSSVMGATKSLAEKYVQSLQGGATRYTAVRFGNVLGSSGSVVPIFKDQIARGGPVEVTDPRMTRYFMTIPEACQLVLQSASLDERGDVFILDMGEPVRILDLAEDLIRLSGLTPGDDIEIVFTGVRPGEKLEEQLALAKEDLTRTSHEKIFVGHKSDSCHLTALPDDLYELEQLVEHSATGDEIRERLMAAVDPDRVVSESRPRSRVTSSSGRASSPPRAPLRLAGGMAAGSTE